METYKSYKLSDHLKENGDTIYAYTSDVWGPTQVEPMTGREWAAAILEMGYDDLLDPDWDDSLPYSENQTRYTTDVDGNIWVEQLWGYREMILRKEG